MGFKDFANGYPLNATEVDNYLMRQTVMVFADSTARTEALTGIETEGMFTYLTATDAFQYYSGSAWVDVVQGASYVTLTGTQTVTNKTLTSPVINTATVNSPVLANPSFTGAALEGAYITATGFAGYTYDVTTNGAVQYITGNSTSNGTINIRSTSGQTLNALMATGQSISIVLAVTNNATPFYPTAWQIDGSAVTPKWQGGTAPTAGNASSIDVYSIVVIKTGSGTFTVLAAQTKFA